MKVKGGVGDLKMPENFSKDHSWKCCRKSLYILNANVTNHDQGPT